jgi:hypothetical protein
MNLTILSAFISAALAGAGGFGAAWKIQAANITQIELRQANERIAVQRAARAAIESNMQRVAAAQSNAADRVRRANLDNARSASALDSLRTASASALRAAANDTATCTASLASHSVVVGKCSQEVVRLASDLDDWASHTVTLQDAWPK